MPRILKVTFQLVSEEEKENAGSREELAEIQRSISLFTDYSGNWIWIGAEKKIAECLEVLKIANAD